MGCGCPSERTPTAAIRAMRTRRLTVDCNPEVVRFLAYTGLRWGEMAALRVCDFDMLRRRVNVSRSVTESGFPAALADEMAALMIGKGTKRCHRFKPALDMRQFGKDFTVCERGTDEHDVTITLMRRAVGDPQVPVERIARLREHCGSVSRGADRVSSQRSSSSASAKNLSTAAVHPASRRLAKSRHRAQRQLSIAVLAKRRAPAKRPLKVRRRAADGDLRNLFSESLSALCW
jgi:hypothetical protein